MRDCALLCGTVDDSSLPGLELYSPVDGRQHAAHIELRSKPHRLGPFHHHIPPACLTVLQHRLPASYASSPIVCFHVTFKLSFSILVFRFVFASDSRTLSFPRLPAQARHPHSQPPHYVQFQATGDLRPLHLCSRLHFPKLNESVWAWLTSLLHASLTSFA